jgi:DNA-binding transcriptional MerR regulator/methylmalonyl-CoA mutase cobalamin-binding subunit
MAEYQRMARPSAVEAVHPMKSALRRTGLSADVLRSWETRYKAISPERSKGGHRLYSEEDIERLILLQRLLAMGHRIGQLASLRSDRLRAMLMDEAAAVVGETDPAGDPAEPLLHAALRESAACDAASLDHTLRRALLSLGLPVFLDQVVTPLLERLREHDGAETGGGRVAGAVTSALLAEARRLLPAPPDALRVLIATPEPVQEDVGLQMLATTAAVAGWHAIYLGAGVASAAFAETATRAGVRVVGIWLSNGDGDSKTRLRAIREVIPAEVAIIVAGPGAAERARELTAAGLGILPSRQLFTGFLESFR